MKKPFSRYCLPALVGLLSLSSVASAQASPPPIPATIQPNLSVIGLMNATFSHDAPMRFGVDEIELNYQSYLYPGVKASVISSIHSEEGGERHLALEEAFVEFSDFFGVAMPNYSPSFLSGTGLTLGLKRIPFGKLNTLHPEQLKTIDRPAALRELLGGDEGLALEGVLISRLLPTPFFTQLELGAWKNNASGHSHEDEDEGHHEGPEYSGNTASARLWTSLAPANSDYEVEWGISGLLSNGASTSEATKTFGTDITLSKYLTDNRSLRLQAEWLSSSYHAEESETRSGGYLYAGYHVAKTGYLGARFDFVERSHEEDAISTYSLILAKHLTETTRLRTQIMLDSEASPLILMQFIFGFGPHTHTIE